MHIVDPVSACWDWLGNQNHYGYGILSSGALAHRVEYAKHADLPSGTDLDHLCRRRHCVNPAHLEPCSRGENVRRGAEAKLTWDAVSELRQAAATMTGSQRQIARELAPAAGVSEHAVRGVLRGSRWPECDRPRRDRGQKRR